MRPDKSFHQTIVYCNTEYIFLICEWETSTVPGSSVPCECGVTFTNFGGGYEWKVLKSKN